MERTGVIAVLTASLLMTACQVDLSISSLVPDNPVSLNKPASAEIVSASTQLEQSAGRGYFIQASAGSMTTDQVLISNVRGYKLYQGVQAQIISQDPR
jgi:hypothetical protein